VLLPVLLVQRLFLALRRTKVISVVVIRVLPAHGAHPEQFSSQQTTPSAVSDREHGVFTRMSHFDPQPGATWQTFVEKNCISERQAVGVFADHFQRHKVDI
jgi:hypothetical protein